MNIFVKVINWIRVVFSGVLGIIQGHLKVLKEVLTCAINIFSLLIPFEVAQTLIEGIRDIVNGIDGALENGKNWLLAPLRG